MVGNVECKHSKDMMKWFKKFTMYDNTETIATNSSEPLLGLHSVSNRFSDPKFIDNVCISYRHDFGLLSEDEQNKVRFECKEWMRAIKNNEPY